MYIFRHGVSKSPTPTVSFRVFVVFISIKLFFKPTCFIFDRILLYQNCFYFLLLFSLWILCNPAHIHIHTYYRTKIYQAGGLDFSRISREKEGIFFFQNFKNIEKMFDLIIFDELFILRAFREPSIN